MLSSLYCSLVVQKFLSKFDMRRLNKGIFRSRNASNARVVTHCKGISIRKKRRSKKRRAVISRCIFYCVHTKHNVFAIPLKRNISYRAFSSQTVAMKIKWKSNPSDQRFCGRYFFASLTLSDGAFLFLQALTSAFF